MMAYTEWRLIEVDEHGDIEHIDSGKIYPMELQLEKLEPSPGCILTIEGVRDYDDGRRAFKRHGGVKGPIDHPARATWAVDDAEWYEPGDEPDFERRGA